MRAALARCYSSSSTANADEVAHFGRLAAHWWDERGEFRVLHQMNPVRLRFLLAKLADVHHNEHDTQPPSGPRALAGLDVLDVGCGGGLLSESIARLGARTLGIDAAPANIGIAAAHARADPALAAAPLVYRAATAESLLAEPRRFDAVCALEVLEHVDHPADFLRACCALLKPGGHLFLSTIARTPLAYFLTIFLAEHVLRTVTPGTHTYSKYISPAELLAFFRDDMHWFSGTPSRLQAEARGIIYLPWLSRWSLAAPASPAATQCNYLFWARKPRE